MYDRFPHLFFFWLNYVPFQTNVKLEEDSILADILGEIDGNKTSAAGTTSHSNSSLQAIHEEKNKINEYMASFSKNALKKRDLKEVDADSDDVRSCRFYIRLFIG